MSSNDNDRVFARGPLLISRGAGGRPSRAAKDTAPRSPVAARRNPKTHQAVLAAAEAAVALAIALNFYNSFNTIDVDQADQLQG